jgi:hypothetical protein
MEAGYEEKYFWPKGANKWLGVSLAAIAIGATLLSTNYEAFGYVLLILGVSTACAVMFWHQIRMFKSAYKRTEVKFMMGLFFSVAATICLADGARMVNQVVEFESASLVYSPHFAAMILAPLYLLYAITFISVLGLLASIVRWLVITPIRTRSEAVKGWFGKPASTIDTNSPIMQFFGYAIFAFSLSVVLGYQDKIRDAAKIVTAEFIYRLEATKYSRCTLPEGARAIMVNDEEMVFVKRADNFEVVFKPGLCEPKLRVQ